MTVFLCPIFVQKVTLFMRDFDRTSSWRWFMPVTQHNFGALADISINTCCLVWFPHWRNELAWHCTVLAMVLTLFNRSDSSIENKTLLERHRMDQQAFYTRFPSIYRLILIHRSCLEFIKRACRRNCEPDDLCKEHSLKICLCRISLQSAIQMRWNLDRR